MARPFPSKKETIKAVTNEQRAQLAWTSKFFTYSVWVFQNNRTNKRQRAQLAFEFAKKATDPLSR